MSVRGRNVSLMSAWWACAVCGHVYQDRADLVSATNEVQEGVARRTGQSLTAGDRWTLRDWIACCAFCGGEVPGDRQSSGGPTGTWR